jgi:drug/metabolite transporter (DMT)-like permease
MILAALMLTIMVAMVKHVRADLSALDVVFWRGLTSIPLGLLIARGAKLRLHNPPLFALRTLLGFCAMVGYFVSAKELLVADISLIGKLQPILLVLIAPLFLGARERAGGFIWVVLIAGVTGTALILAPGLAVGSVYGLYCLGATVLSAGAHVCIRALMRNDDARVVVFYFQACVMVLALVAIAVTTGGLPPLPEWELLPYLAGIGITATVGQVLMTQAYKEDRAAVVAAARYAAPIWAITADIVVFGVMPSWHVFVGGTIIVTAGMILLLSRNQPPPVLATSE